MAQTEPGMATELRQQGTAAWDWLAVSKQQWQMRAWVEAGAPEQAEGLQQAAMAGQARRQQEQVVAEHGGHQR